MDIKVSRKKIAKSISIESAEKAKKEKSIDGTLDKNPECGCKDHTGVIMLSKVINLSIDHLYECLFGMNEFYLKFARLRKMSDLVVGEWQTKLLNGFEIKTRDVEYIIGITSAFSGSKSLRTNLQERVLNYVPFKIYVIETESISSGPMYADCFKVITRLCLTKTTSSSTRLVIHSTINYVNKPNFIIKGIIDKTCDVTIKEHFKDLGKLLNEYGENFKASSPKMITMSKNSSFSDGSSSSLMLSSEIDSSLDESQTEKSVNISNETSYDLNNTQLNVYESQTVLEVNTGCSNNDKKESCSGDENTVNLELQQTSTDANSLNLKKNVSTKNNCSQTEACNPNNCPHCEFLKNKEANKKSSYVLNKDLFMKILLFIMLIVIILNYFLFLKLANLESIALRLILKKQINQNGS